MERWGLQADPAKQKKAGGPCKCGRTQSISWYTAGMQCSACCKAANRDRKRKAQQAKQKGQQSITRMFGAAAGKKLKQDEAE